MYQLTCHQYQVRPALTMSLSFWIPAAKDWSSGSLLFATWASQALSFSPVRLRSICTNCTTILWQKASSKIDERKRNICAIDARRKARTTNSQHRFLIAPNLLNRNFEASAPNKKWVADITFIETREGWLYLSGVLDMYSRKIIGWAQEMHLFRVLQSVDTNG